MKKILIVEDDEASLDTLAITLKKEGYLVYTAVDTPTGIKKLKDEDPDLLILDIMLPGGEGFAVAERARILPRDIPVIFITASKGSEYKIKAAELGAAAYFEKPYHLAELVAVVKDATGGV